MVKTWAKRLYMAFIFLLLYLPIIVLIVLSFNKSKARVTWRGMHLPLRSRWLSVLHWLPPSSVWLARSVSTR